MSVTYHPLGRLTRLRFLLMTGAGLPITGQVPTVRIKRRSDSQYWNGANFQIPVFNNNMVEEDAVNVPGTYYFDFDQTLAGANPEEYLMRYTNAAPNAALDEEQNVYLALPPVVGTVSLRTPGYSMSDDGINLKLSLWVNENGLRVTNFTSMTVSIKDNAGNLIVAVCTSTVQTSDGVFAFQTAITAIQRNTPYILVIQATRPPSTTDNYDIGFVRV
jgi:hypothetical protein